MPIPIHQVGVIFALFWAACGLAGTPDVREGDLVFQTSLSSQSLAIQRATDSPYSHVGIILHKAGKPHVFEAVAKVSYTPLSTWIARGQDQRFVAKRLRKNLEPSQLARLRSEARRFEGRPYDLTFEWSDRRIYCSELVWKLYRRATGIELGTLQRLRDFHLEDPVVRAKLRERYGSAIPLDEPVISPAAVFDSPLLETVQDP